ncbi:MAG TPA: Calx-beta domain-containing protein [Vicinamibacterales bacterium]|jgi:uncharacterized delta-60 repeat protein
MTRALVLFPVIAMAALPSWCDPPLPNPTLDLIVRRWSFSKVTLDSAREEQAGDERVQVGGSVAETIDFGPLVLHPPAGDPRATAEVFSNDTGRTYWVGAVAPSAVVPSGDPIGNAAVLTQIQYFTKTDPNARLELIVSRTSFEAIDSNPGEPTATECPWHRTGGFGDCLKIMSAFASFSVTAFSFADQTILVHTGGRAVLDGFRGRWDFNAYTDAGSTRPFWSRSSFALDRDVDEDGGGHASAQLLGSIAVDVPLSSVPVGETFFVDVTVKTDTFNRRQRESFLSAFFRDPEGSRGLRLAFTGVQPIETPIERPAPVLPAPAPPCTTGLDPAAGTLHFQRVNYRSPELAPGGAEIIVTRENGRRGAISARLSTTNSTAVAGSDYTPVDMQIVFPDGEDGDRLITIPILNDRTSEGSETIGLALTEASGCGRLGPRSNAVVTILDDDDQTPPPPPQTFSVGGTVSGLAGTGLVLQQAGNGTEVKPVADGAFTFDTRLPSGAQYDVRVGSQPIGPIQVCSVTNGTGTVDRADVTNIEVTCITPPPQGSLDATFGDGGKVTDGLPGGATAMALQADGKIVLLGGLKLARYNPDGRIDAGFGTAGTATILFNGGLLDAADDVAIQPDGRIVVVGITRVGTQDDFALARFNQDGTPDASFGINGTVSTDFAGSTDRAWAVVVDADGRIVVAGHAATPSPTGGDNDFAVARYTNAGTLDPTFGTGGKVMTNIAGRTDLAFAARLQSDEKIVVTGRVADGGGDTPDVGLVRYNVDGTLDTAFGTNGIVRVDLTTTGNWDEASDLALQADGRIVVSVQILVGSSFVFGVARFNGDGRLDPSFGTGGLTTVTFSSLNDFARGIAVQEDGKILVAGQSANLMNPDVAMARLTTAGGLDPAFGSGGKVAVDFFGSIDNGQAVAIQPDGKLLVAGAARNGTAVGLGLIRLLP